MAGFYRMDFKGRASSGAGAIAIVNGKIAGIDMDGIIFNGSYKEEGDRLVGSMALKLPAALQLVTGQVASAGSAISVPFDVDKGQLDGHEISVTVGGRPATARLTKIADL